MFFVGIVVALLASPLVALIALRIFSFSKQPRRRVEEFLQKAKVSGGVFAHRGGRPENTLAAIRKSHGQGAAGVEVDLAFSKDGPVLIHDSTVDRTSNGRGQVSEMTLADLKALDFGTKTGG